MPKIRFKHTVLRDLSELINSGYRFEEGRHTDLLEFRKTLATGVYGSVEFQLLQHFIPPIREFNVILLRMRLPNFSAPEPQFKILNAELRHIMKSIYGQDIFPPGKFMWEFTNETMLLEQLGHAESLLIQYGIKWLEDPSSNMEWIKRAMG